MLFGGQVIASFSYAMIFGVVIGTYSSIFIAAPVLIYLGLKVGAEAPAGEAAAPAPSGTKEAARAARRAAGTAARVGCPWVACAGIVGLMSGGRRYDGFVPGRHIIDAYGNGGFRFAGMSHRGSILVLPSGVLAWPVAGVADLTPEVFAPVLAEAGDIKVLLIGTGSEIGVPAACAAAAHSRCWHRGRRDADRRRRADFNIVLPKSAGRCRADRGGMTERRSANLRPGHCADGYELVRKQDPDRYLACLFAPEASGPHLLALYSFSLEMARVRELVSEPLTGEIRMQWWRELLTARGGATSAPIRSPPP